MRMLQIKESFIERSFVNCFISRTRTGSSLMVFNNTSEGRYTYIAGEFFKKKTFAEDRIILFFSNSII